MADPFVGLQEFLDYLENHTFLGARLSTILSLLVVVAVAVILERVITRRLSKFARRTHLAPHAANNLVLAFRLLILVGCVAAVVRVGGLPTEWFVAFSALGGAAVGLSSTKTIGNFIAGLYLLMARPFRVGEYVRLGTVEGIVKEMGINYTKVLTTGNNVVSISNLQIMDRDITNFLYEKEDGVNIYCYTFEIGFDHSVSTTKIGKVFDKVFKEYAGEFTQEPSYMLTRSDAFGRVYTVYLYPKNPKDIFSLRPQIAEKVFKLWDEERK